MANVDGAVVQVNDPIEQAVITGDPSKDTTYSACKWLLSQVPAGRISATKAENHNGALINLTSVLTESESHTVNDVYAGLDKLPRRWLEKKNNGKKAASPASARTYLVKARWLLETYIDFCAKGAEKFNYDKLHGRRASDTPRAPRVPKVQPMPVQAPPDPENTITCSFGAKGSAKLTLPFPINELTVDQISFFACQIVTMIPNFNVKAAGLIGCHLATRGQDFDPRKPIQTQMFGD